MPVNEDHYEYIRAEVDCGELVWKYKLNGGRDQSLAHDEDVSDYSQDDIKRLTRQMIDVDDDDPVQIEVVYN